MYAEFAYYVVLYMQTPYYSVLYRALYAITHRGERGEAVAHA